MEKLTFINSRGQSVVLGDSAPYILIKLEGIGAVTANIQTQKAPYQDGTTFIDAVLEPRIPFAEVIIITDSAEAMASKRRELASVFNPKLGKGKLIYDNGAERKVIEAVAEMAPIFPDAGDFKETMQPALINLYCADPLFMDEYESSQEMAAWLGGLQFAMTFPLKFGLKSSLAKIRNDGDVATPVTIEFNGPALNPVVKNETTGEAIKVNRELYVGDKLVIVTEFGNKSVKLVKPDGTEENAMHWLDLDSVFWQLQVGDNDVSYDADVGTDEAVVLMRYRNRYVGV